MKFIYFEEWNLKEKILAEGIHLRPNHRKINEESLGIFCYPMLKSPFKVPVAEDHYDYLAFKKEEEILNELFTIEESWEVVGASRVRKGNKNVLGVIFEMELKHWPITVFINIHSFLANEFGQILCDSPNVDIFYYGQNKNSFLEFIKIIELKNYLLQSVPFTVNTEDALLDLINILEEEFGKKILLNV